MDEDRKRPALLAGELDAFVRKLAKKPLSTEDTRDSWIPLEWEDIVELWDEFVTEARKLTGETYR